MNFKPFGQLVLVEVLNLGKEVENKTGLYMPDKMQTRFWKVKIIEIGPKVELPMMEGDIVLANPVAEIDDKNFFPGDLRIIHATNLLGVLEKAKK